MLANFFHFTMLNFSNFKHGSYVIYALHFAKLNFSSFNLGSYEISKRIGRNTNKPTIKMKDDENRQLNNNSKTKITNLDTVDQIDRLEVMKKQRKAKKEQLTTIFQHVDSELQKRDF